MVGLLLGGCQYTAYVRNETERPIRVHLIQRNLINPDWKPAAAPLRVTRQPDVDLARPDGTSAKARFYKQVLTTPFGAFSSDTWTDERGVMLKSVMTMPFGQLTVELRP